MIRINQITRARWNSAIQRHRLVSLPTSSVTLYPRSLRFDHHIQHSSIRYMSTHKYTNRLAKEKSPYLLQHQHNPVDWYPWGEEAFKKAIEEDKPIFLSVGYSTCHWCHVMERESFENEHTAKIMNESFVNIKLDREERPDIDKAYVQATTGGGGWPMSVWLAPQTLQPFFGGTYFPPTSKYGRPGFADLCRRISALWKEHKEEILKSESTVMEAIKERYAEALEVPEEEKNQPIDGGRPIKYLVHTIQHVYDPRYGGFSRAPKFPRPVVFTGLLHAYKILGQEDILEKIEFTLRKMAEGGIHDHLGGGFHRYSVTKDWFVPHFEKMLYDQAQLVIAYLEAYQITKNQLYANVARKTLDYVLRQMTHPEGGFYSAEDADSPIAPGSDVRGEGAFYVWTYDEIHSLLTPDEAAVITTFFGVDKNGNVDPKYDAHNEFTGKNILMQRMSLENCAMALAKSVEETTSLLQSGMEKLFVAREKRPRPHLDDKILSAWNGLLISALAKAYKCLDDERYLEAGKRALHFLKANLYRPDEGILLRNYREGPGNIHGFADDYAFVIASLLDMYEACFDHSYLEWAVQLQNKMDELFWDKERGGYFSVDGSDPTIIIRMKEDYDGAEPSPNSVALQNLVRLSNIFHEEHYRSRAENLVKAFRKLIYESPLVAPLMVAGTAALTRPHTQVVLAGKFHQPELKALLRVVNSHYDPFRVVLLADGGEGQAFLRSKGVDYISEGDMTLNGKPTAYVCRHFTCQQPTSDPKQLEALLSMRDTG